MADTKISALPSASTPLAGTEVLPIVQSGVTDKVSVENILTSVQPSGTANGVVFLNGSKVATTNANFTYNGSSLVVKTGTSVTDNFVLESTDDGASASPDLVLYRNSSSPAASDSIGNILFRGKDSSAADASYAFLLAQITSPTAGASAATFSIRTRQASDGLVDRISIASNVTVNTGNLVIGTSGKGIDFSASSHAAGMTSELLSDYEEGTWTPTISYTTPGTLSVTYADQAGSYVKIGSQVTVWFGVTLSAFTKGTASGWLLIDGLPFTVGSYTATKIPRGIGMLSTYNAPISGTLGCYVYARESTTQAWAVKNVNNAAFVPMDDPDSNSVYISSFTYWV